MIRSLRPGLAWAAAALFLAAPPASAHIINPAHCTIPARIAVVGHQSGQPDAGGHFEVVVRDFGDPLQNVMVMVDFSRLPDIRMSGDVLVPGAGLFCSEQRIAAITNAAGIARFSIVGAGIGPPQCFGSSGCSGRVQIYADGVLLGEPRVSAFDLDGASGVGGADLSLWLQDFGSSLDPLRSDYDGNGGVDGADLSLWLARFGAGGSPQSAGVYCP